MVKSQSTSVNIFTNMVSRINPKLIQNPEWPQSLILPQLPSVTASTYAFHGKSTNASNEPTMAEKLELLNFLSKKKETKKNTACPHPERKHYAKNMCSKCYHKSGRSKPSYACQHTDRPLYARGMCQVCYLHNYHKARM
jgi:hypothetical protein